MFDFPDTVPDLETVPEPFRPLYQQAGGDFALIPALNRQQVTADFTAQIDGLKTTQEKLQGELAAFQQLAPTPDELTGQLTDLRQRGDGYFKESVAATAIAQAKGSIPLLLPHLQDNLQVTENAGEIFLQVIMDGKPRLRDSGEAFTVNDLLGEMKTSPTFARAFDGGGIAGGGMGASPAGSAPSKISRFDQSALNARLEDIAAGKISVT